MNIDDFGLKPLTPPGPQDMYDVISGRYETGSNLLTSNRAPSEWMALFHDPILGSAGLDKLIHDAYALVFAGASYRAHGSSVVNPFATGRRIQRFCAPVQAPRPQNVVATTPVTLSPQRQLILPAVFLHDHSLPLASRTAQVKRAVKRRRHLLVRLRLDSSHGFSQRANSSFPAPKCPSISRSRSRTQPGRHRHRAGTRLRSPGSRRWQEPADVSRRRRARLLPSQPSQRIRSLDRSM
ncbi:MAG: ATP-binding protein [Caldilineaceae bacterium]|nr:ATP-binding protein [Caldilineaceae bacterium]